MKFARILEQAGEQIVAMLSETDEGDYAVRLYSEPEDGNMRPAEIAVHYDGHARAEEFCEALLDGLTYDMAESFIYAAYLDNTDEVAIRDEA